MQIEGENRKELFSKPLQGSQEMPEHRLLKLRHGRIFNTEVKARDGTVEKHQSLLEALQMWS